MLSDSPHSTPRLKRLAVRTAAVACAIAVGFGLAGCGSSTAGTVTLDFFQFKSEAADQFKSMVADFEKQNPTIKVNINNSANAQTDLRTRFVKNRVPDVITFNGDISFGNFAASGVFYDFTDEPIVDTLNPGMVQIAKNLVQTTDSSKKRLHLDLAVESTSPFNPRDAFGSHSDSDHVYNTPRAWVMQRFLNPYDEMWDGPEADHRPDSDDIPWARQPERKVTIEDVKYVLSSHYQGTPFDPYGHLGDEHTRHMYRPIGINRQSQLAVMQIRPYRPQSDRAIQWIAYGSNPFNTLVPFYPNVNETPKYLEDTTTRVTSENFYWENRIIAALCDAAFAETSNAIERYQEKTGAMGHRLIAATDEQVARLGGADEAAAALADAELEAANADGDVEPMDPEDIIDATRNDEVRDILAAANQTMADQLKTETDQLLDTVLYTVSMKMKNGFNRSDN
mgnify:CR=1 FL=1